MRLVLLTACALIACRAAPRPEQQLKDSFVRQIASTSVVRDVQRSGDVVSFTARYGKDVDAKWRVQIDSAIIDQPAEGSANQKGTIKSSWYVNGEQIRPRGSQSDLPLPFLDNGLAQECWALWDDRRHEWSWK